jgi:hypothetical protein
MERLPWFCRLMERCAVDRRRRNRPKAFHALAEQENGGYVAGVTQKSRI